MDKFLGTIFIVLMIVEFAEPIQFIKRFYQIDNNSQPKELYKQVLQKFFNCALCVGFWTGLIVYQDIYMAAIISFASELAHRIVNQIFNRI